MPRVLIVGFSVTADPRGYAPRTANALASSGVAVDILGVGGIQVEPLAGLVKRRLMEQNYDWVVFEIATSIIGKRARSFESQVIDPIYDLLAAVREHGARSAFLNLFRSEFDYSYHQFDMLVESIAARHRIPLLDLGAGLERHQGREFCLSTIRDVTHTNELGAEFQSHAVTDFIAHFLQEDARQLRTPNPRVARISIPMTTLVAASGEIHCHSRAGLQCDYVRIGEGELVQVSLERPMRLLGLGILTHPRAGNIDVTIPGQDGFRVAGFYDASYYEHYVFKRFTPVPRAQSFSVHQDSGLPTIAPRKGRPDGGAREGRLVDLHVF